MTVKSKLETTDIFNSSYSSLKPCNPPPPPPKVNPPEPITWLPCLQVAKDKCVKRN